MGCTFRLDSAHYSCSRGVQDIGDVYRRLISEYGYFAAIGRKVYLFLYNSVYDRFILICPYFDLRA